MFPAFDKTIQIAYVKQERTVPWPQLNEVQLAFEDQVADCLLPDAEITSCVTGTQQPDAGRGLANMAQGRLDWKGRCSCHYASPSMFLVRPCVLVLSRDGASRFVKAASCVSGDHNC